MKKAGKLLNADDKAAILWRSRELRGEGVGVADAARQSVEERLGDVRAMLAAAEDDGPEAAPVVEAVAEPAEMPAEAVQQVAEEV